MHPPIFFKILNVAAKNRIEQACYVKYVVALKLGYYMLWWTNVMGIVKATALRCNLLCQRCYTWKRLILFWFIIGNWGDISLLCPCYIFWIYVVIYILDTMIKGTDNVGHKKWSEFRNSCLYTSIRIPMLPCSHCEIVFCLHSNRFYAF